MKNKILLFGAACLAAITFAGCESYTADHPTTFSGNYTGDTNGAGGTVTGQVMTDITPHISAGGNVSYDTDTHDLTTGFIVVLKGTATEYARQQLARAGGIDNGGGVWVLPESAPTREASGRAVDLVSIAIAAAGAEPGGCDLKYFDKRSKSRTAAPQWPTPESLAGLLSDDDAAKLMAGYTVSVHLKNATGTAISALCIQQ